MSRVIDFNIDGRLPNDLPKDNEAVVISDSSGHIWVGQYINGEWNIMTGMSIPQDMVMRWMPLDEWNKTMSENKNE
jgi:hypothetical protein